MTADDATEAASSNLEAPAVDTSVLPAPSVPQVTLIQNVRASRLLDAAPTARPSLSRVSLSQRPSPAEGEPAVHSQVEAEPGNPIPGFFERNREPRREIVEGLLREGQIMAIGGPYGVGKSPLLQNLTVCRIRGIEWCGRNVVQGPVILLDFESSGPAYRRGVQNICSRYNVPTPNVPEELDVYLLNDEASSPPTSKLLAAVATEKVSERLALLQEALTRNPNALVIIDPPEVLFRIDTGKKIMILALYRALRILISEFPDAAILLSFNMRKKDRRSNAQPNLLTDPRNWLEEVCGTLDIMNRCDVRLGMDFYGEDARVINGVRRSEDMHPLLVRQVGNPPDGLSGFELCPPDRLSLEFSFTTRQITHWRALPAQFRFEHVADSHVPRSSLYRLLQRAKSLGLVSESNCVWTKAV